MALPEYRRVGNPGGGWPGTFEDVRTGFKAAREEARQDLPWLVLGHSAGGHLALWLSGETDAMAATVALAPVADLEWPAMPRLCLESIERLLGGSSHVLPEVYAAANPAKRRAQAPQTLLHGLDDELVPIGISRDFRPQGGAKPELLEVPGGHFDIIDPGSPAWQATLGALERLSLP
ncbi:MAG: putative lipase/esterase [Holophagaceae bacterium]|nr:putative lipase/esterase [Holophagaceae bacterium]